MIQMPAQEIVHAKMQKLSLNDDPSLRSADSATHAAFGSPGYTRGIQVPPYLQSSPVGMDRSLVKACRCIAPIATVNPYQTRWTIKARVTAKTDIRHYSNARGSAKVFSFVLLDAHGGEARATCFNSVADQFYDKIEADKVYFISNGTVKPAQKKYYPLNGEYELTLDASTTIEVCSDGDSSIPRQQYSFQEISKIEKMEYGSFVDLIGVVISVSPSATIMREDGTGTKKRTIQLKDMSGRSMEITFWGKCCDVEGPQLQLLCNSGLNPVLALKRGHISDFGSKSVSVTGSTQLEINPDLPEAEDLKLWYTTEGKTAACLSLTRGVPSIRRSYVQKTVAQIRDENLRRSDKPDLVTVKAVISHVKTDKFCYPACTCNVKQCNRKVSRNEDGTWYCVRCNQNSQNCEYRYLLQCQIQDHTGSTYATAFQEAGEEIVGLTAQELFTITHVEQDYASLTEIMQRVLWRPYLFQLRIKEENYNGEWRVKCTILAAEGLDVSDASHNLLEEISGLSKDASCSTLENASRDVANIGLADLKTRHSVQTSNYAYGYSARVDGAGLGDFANRLSKQAGLSRGGISTPLSVPSECFKCNGCFMDLPRLSSGTSSLILCFKCKQPGHWARDCPLRAT